MSVNTQLSEWTLLRRSLVTIPFVIAIANGVCMGSGDRPVSFRNEVMPTLTKAGCNAGVCHAKAGGGQNGFELSLLGFEPDDDYNRLVRDAGGRRILPMAADESLLLLKATGQIPHGGGTRLTPDSAEFQTVHDWIAQGALRDAADSARPVSLAVDPAKSVTPRGSRQQLRVLAQFSDGTKRDVTSLSLFESHDEAMATADEDGLVEIHNV